MIGHIMFAHNFQVYLSSVSYVLIFFRWKTQNIMKSIDSIEGERDENWYVSTVFAPPNLIS